MRNLKEFIQESKNKFGERYDYSKSEYVTSKTKTIIICPVHGEFLQSPRDHLRSTGCPKCYSEKVKVSTVPKVITIPKEPKVITTKKISESQAEKFKQFSSNENLEFPKKIKEIVDFIKSELNITNVIENDKTILNGKEINIYLPDFKIGFEFNGLYWHNQQNLESKGEIAKKYHLNKTLQCKENGIRLIHIFEDEWENKRSLIKSRIKHFVGIYDKKIGARKCKIKPISPETRNRFLEVSHLQGPDRASFSYGSFFNDELVGVMSFCKPRLSMGMKGDFSEVYELSRFAVKQGYQIIGLASKMFSHFIKEVNPKQVYTYSDIRWNKLNGTGSVYENIGMEYSGTSEPSYFYIVNQKREYRFKYRKQELPNLLPVFDDSLTEYENCLNNGLDRIFDCGCEKYIYNKKEEK